MSIRLALAGDTMLGRAVGERLSRVPPGDLVAPGVVDAAGEADLFVLNLECCISDRGKRWPSPDKPFFFRAPPEAVSVLHHLGVGCVTLANNHALDYGAEALLDTLELLDGAGIAHAGAGQDERAARAPAVLTVGGVRVAVVGFTDHPAEFAAGPDRPGVAHADLDAGVPAWLTSAIGGARAEADVVLVSPHWGPNMQPDPVPHVRRAGPVLVEAGATLVAGHSAHVFQGVAGRIVHDLGDFLDDYAVEPDLRNDLGLLYLVDLDSDGPIRLEAVPLALDHCHTRLADPEEAAWIESRFRAACAALGTAVAGEEGRLVIRWR
ncbi:MAG: CapA family protein [Actinobacteria bacterium]|nr:CapA family protein [Actinomycetota bacterium]